VLVEKNLHGFDFASAGTFDLKGLEPEELFIAFRTGQIPLGKVEDAYRQHIIERFGKLTLYSVTSEKPLAVDLEQVFVKLTASEKRVAKALVLMEGGGEEWVNLDALAPPRFEGYDPRGKKSKAGGFTASGMGAPPQETVVTLTLNEALREHQVLAILGAPGSGKTTLLKYVALSFARKQAAPRLGLEDDLLPIFLALRDLSRWLDAQDKQNGLPHLGPELLARYLSDSYAQIYPSLNLPPNFFVLALAQRRCAVLLDGLDEIADSMKRIRAAELIASCLNHYVGNRFLITSRPRGYETACRLHLAAHCGECSVRDFDDEQIQSFAKSWYLAVTVDREGDNLTARDDASHRAEDLLAAVKTERVRPLATNPLLLSILALIHQRGNQLPQRRVALYEECVEFLLGYWYQVQDGDAARELAGVGGLSRTEKRALLEPVALWLHERGAHGAEVSKAELEGQLACQFAELYAYKEAEALRRAREFVEIIVLHAGLLVERESGVFAFAHLTFQEFLCARALADRADYWRTLRPHLHDPWWREVVLLLAGHLSGPGTRRAREDTAELLNQIGDAKSPLENALHRDLLLAFRCLCDMEQLGIEASRREQLVEEVWDLWRQTGIEALRDEIFELFQYAAPTPTGELICRRLLLLSQDGNEEVRASAADALGRLGAAAATPEVVAQLVALIQDGNEGVRASAVYALGRLGAAAATPEVVARLVALIQDGNEGVRASAADALGRLGAAAATPEVVARLVALTKDGNEGVRASAASALGRLGAAVATPEVVGQMILMLKDAPLEVGANLAYACGQAGEKLSGEGMAALIAFWQKHLGTKGGSFFGDEYRKYSSAAYEQLKHLAALGAAFLPR
jgi:energy-coupling factor transporter ATP-binding protein EcfA2